MLQPLLSIVAVLSVLSSFSPAQTKETVLHKFQGNSDGFDVRSGVVVDAKGDMFGTSFFGGGAAGAGIVYEMTPPATIGGAWTETVIHRFSYHDIGDGLSPWGGLAMDGDGDLFGTAWLGGTCGSCGLVFELSPPATQGGTWAYQVIHDFIDDGLDGMNPQADLVIDAQGELFGTTSAGGAGGCVGGCGTVFELSRSGGIWVDDILHSFPAHGNGFDASGGTGGSVTLDSAGNVFGTTREDGLGLGTVFELARPAPGGRWRYRNIYSFSSEADGFDPEAGVAFDSRGNLYGTTNSGGVQGCYGVGCGTVFRLKMQPDGSWSHVILYAFRGTGDGGTPTASVIVGPDGVVYGTTQIWGTGNGCTGSGCGVAYSLTRPMRPGMWRQTVLHTFLHGADGYVPYGELVFGPGGLIYGATEFGGKPTCESGFGCGTVFSVTP